MKKKSRWIVKFLRFIIIFVALFVFILFITTDNNDVTRIFGIIPIDVVDDTMEPTIMQDDLILINSKTSFDKLRKNDVMVYMNKGKNQNNLIIHRVMKAKRNYNNEVIYVTTKGDNSNKIDSLNIYRENYVGFYTGIRIPYFGKILKFLKSGLGFIIFVILPILLFFFYEVILYYKVVIASDKKESIINDGLGENNSFNDSKISFDKALAAPIVVSKSEANESKEDENLTDFENYITDSREFKFGDLNSYVDHKDKEKAKPEKKVKKDKKNIDIENKNTINISKLDEDKNKDSSKKEEEELELI